MSCPSAPKISPRLAATPLVSILSSPKTHRTALDGLFDAGLGSAQACVSGFDVHEEQSFHLVLLGEPREHHVIDRLEQGPAIARLVRKARKGRHDLLDDLSEVKGFGGLPVGFCHPFSVSGKLAVALSGGLP